MVWNLIFDITMILFCAHIISTYSQIWDKRSNFKILTLLAYIAYILFQYWIMISNAENPVINLSMGLILIACIFILSCNISLKTALFHAFILSFLWMLVEIITGFILSKTSINQFDIYFITGNIITKIVLYILVQAIKCYKKIQNNIALPFRDWAFLSIIPLSSIFIIHNTFYLSYKSDKNTFFLITAILLFIINYITYSIYDKLSKQMDIEKKNLLYEQEINLCNKQSIERESAYQDTRRVRHDLNNYLLDLKLSLQQNQMSVALEKIDIILQQNRIYRNEICHSGNLAIDSLINHKFSFSQKKDIDFRCNVTCPSELPFNSADLCVMLGNLIDNSLEALSKLNSNNKFINIKINYSKEILTIVVENPFHGNIKINSKGDILTTKTDTYSHGLGITSIKRIVEKYNGELEILHNNGIFQASVLLYPLN